ncbi:MAG TPA: class I SAM-dependent methyltransferase [Thermoanaerobaculia bacterium]|nr:class I SAM-dependent methyltransferase [Thermoanaerobaculia bacterium]
MAAPDGANRDDARVWDDHWAALSGQRSLFGRVASLVRTELLSRAVHAFAERHFPKDGVFVEAGCGTAESSSRIDPGERTLVAMDISRLAVRAARRIPVFRGLLQGDLFRLPFRGGSLAGVWNLGVMEHFEPEEGRAVLREFARVLRPGGVALLFWPPEFGASRLLLAPIEALRSRPGAPFRFFPDEVNRLRSRAHAAAMLAGTGLEPVALSFGPKDLFIHLVVVARKPG